MKKLKILSIVLAAVLALSVGAGCNKNQNANSSTAVQLYYWNSGLGRVWMQEIVDEFNEIQDEYTVEFSYDANASTIIQTLSLGESNTYDLYFTMLNTHNYDDDFANLDDVLDNPAYGETVDIREKYYSYLIDAFENPDGSTHFLNYGNTFAGIVYNTNIIDGEKYEVPRTTLDLEMLTIELSGDSELSNAGVYPWIFYNDTINNGYWNYMIYAWAAQYEGVENFYTRLMELNKGGMTLEEALLEEDGRYEALKALEALITPTFAHPDSTSTNFTRVQTRYLSQANLNGKVGDAVMTINGSWLLNETNLTADVAMMKTPVISSIVNKLEYRGEGGTYMENSELSAVIEVIDNGGSYEDAQAVVSDEQAEVPFSENDFNRIAEARSVIAGNAAQQYVFIPEYSPAKEGAKAFLRYFYSDAGTAAYMNTLRLPAPVRLLDESLVDTSGYSVWNAGQMELASTATVVSDRVTKHQYFLDNSTDLLNGLNYAQLFINSNPVDRKGADYVFGVMQDRILLNLENMQS